MAGSSWTARLVGLLLPCSILVSLCFASLDDCAWTVCIDVQVYNGRPENLSNPHFYMYRGLMHRAIRKILPGRNETTEKKLQVDGRELVIGVCAPLKTEENRLGIGLTRRGREYFRSLFMPDGKSVFESRAVENLANLNKEIKISAGNVTVAARMGDKRIDMAYVKVF